MTQERLLEVVRRIRTFDHELQDGLNRFFWEDLMRTAEAGTLTICLKAGGFEISIRHERKCFKVGMVEFQKLHNYYFEDLNVLNSQRSRRCKAEDMIALFDEVVYQELLALVA